MFNYVPTFLFSSLIPTVGHSEAYFCSHSVFLPWTILFVSIVAFAVS